MRSGSLRWCVLVSFGWWWIYAERGRGAGGAQVSSSVSKRGGRRAREGLEGGSRSIVCSFFLTLMDDLASESRDRCLASPTTRQHLSSVRRHSVCPLYCDGVTVVQ